MPGTVVTLSPRESLERVERLVRARVERDGVVQVAAATGDQRQVRQLRRLTHRLAEDADLDVSLGEHTDGATCLTVFPAGQRSAGVWGDPRIG